MPTREWWQDFFELPDCLQLAAFPSEEQTKREVQAILDLLRPGPSDLILDACCGHGRHSIALSAGGLRVVGLDRSVRLLRAAQKAKRRAGTRTHLVRGDLRQLPFGTVFTIVLNLFNSFGYLEDPADDRLAMSEMARCLRPGGRLLLESRNKDLQCALVPFAQTVRLGDGTKALAECDYDPTSRQLRSRWTRLGVPGGVYAESAIRLYSLREFEGLLRAVGLRILNVYGDYDWHHFRDVDWKLLILAEKPR